MSGPGVGQDAGVSHPTSRRASTERRVLPVATALTAAALAGLLSLSVVTGRGWLVAAAVLLVQLLVAAAPRPSLRGTGGALFGPVLVGSVVATALARDPGLLEGAAGTESARDALVSSGVLAGLLLGVVVVVALTLLAQMLRRDGRGRLVDSAGSTVLLGVVAALGAGWMAAATTSLAPDVVPAAALGVTVALLVKALPGDAIVLGAAGTTLGAVAGGLVPLVVDGVGTWQLGLTVGLAGAGCGLLGRTLGRAWVGDVASPSRPETWVFPAAVAIALAGPVAHVGAQLAVLAL